MITNYVVGDACKGNKPASIEKNLRKDFTLNFESEFGDTKGIAKIVHQCLNRTVAQRTITDQKST
jgi:hypothetical protein